MLILGMHPRFASAAIRWVLLGLVILLHACHPKPTSNAMTARPTRSAEQPIETTMEVSPLRLTMAELDSFDLRLTAINHSAHTIDPLLYNARLLINGKVSLAFMLTVGNGLRGEEWFALPPGQQATIHWNMWNMFEGPGKYELVLDWWGEHEVVRVEVGP